MTGGAPTFDRIVWGADASAAKAANRPLVTKPFEAELGAVSPWIVVPGQWSDAELEHHAKFLASCKMMNSGAICASPQVVFVDADWPQRQRFEALLEKTLADFPKPPVFYVRLSHTLLLLLL
jgi:acyl-CoA reductase-like NAD-dependent aldehyde dehydrogenase